METKRFQLYKVNPGLMKPYLVFCIIMTSLGLAGLISELGFNFMIFNLQTTVFVLLAFQGAFGVYIARKNFDNIKYFVSWDENELNYHLPNNSRPENIRLTDIRKIERQPQKIRIELKTGEVKYFGFNSFFFRREQRFLIFLKRLKQRWKQNNNRLISLMQLFKKV